MDWKGTIEERQQYTAMLDVHSGQLVRVRARVRARGNEQWQG